MVKNTQTRNIRDYLKLSPVRNAGSKVRSKCKKITNRFATDPVLFNLASTSPSMAILTAIAMERKRFKKIKLLPFKKVAA